MRRTLCVLLVSLWGAPFLQAQEAEGRYPTESQQVVMGVAGHFGGGFALVGLGAVALLSDDPELPIPAGLALYALGASASVYGVGRAFGTDGGFGETVRGAYLGLGVGLAVGVPLGWVLLNDVDTLEGAIGATMLGVGLIIAGTLVGSVRGYNASIRPAVWHGANDRFVPGLSVAFTF